MFRDAIASSFADPDDVARYQAAKASGESEQQALRVGDNGRGCWGDDTTDPNLVLFALHRDDIIDKFGSVAAGKHAGIVLQIAGQIFYGLLGDVCGVPGRIDLSRGAQRRAGLKPPFLVPCRWSWADEAIPTDSAAPGTPPPA